MGQRPVVMAFRKRMSFRGYTDIRIIKIRGHCDLYHVVATEPLGKTVVSVFLTPFDMNSMFR